MQDFNNNAFKKIGTVSHHMLAVLLEVFGGDIFNSLNSTINYTTLFFLSLLIDYKCQHCGESFDSKANLRLHKRSFHKKPAILKCSICDRPFASEDSLRVHIVNVHEKKHKYKCQYCDKSYMWPGLLNHHVKEKHEKQVRHTCNFCGKGM